jgi:hypothetical protein
MADIIKEFEGENSEELNVLLTTLVECGKDFARSKNTLAHENSFYSWLEKCDKKVLLKESIAKLHDLGYKIEKINVE